MGVSVAIGAAVGAVVGGAAAAIQSGGNFDAIWKGALVGAAGGAVAGWAAPALAPALGAVGGAMAGGALGGAVAGLGNVALNGGTGDDYLKQGLIGAGIGAATGGLMEASGANAYLNDMVASAPLEGNIPLPAEGGMVTGTPYTTELSGMTTPLPDSLAPSYAPIGIGTESTAASVYSPNVSASVDASGIPLTQAGQYAFDDAIGSVVPSSFGVDTTFSGTPTFAGSDSGFGSFGSASVPENGGLFNTGFGENAFTSSPENVFLKGNDYGVTTNTGQVLDSSGNVLGNAPGWESAGTPTVRGSADVSSGGWSMKDLWNNNKGTLGTMGMLGMGKNLLGGIMKGAAIPSARAAATENNQQLMDLYNLQKQGYEQQLAQQQADAARNQQIYDLNKQAFQNNLQTQEANRAMFNEQRANAAGYNRILSDSYTNPNAYLNSPEAQATRSLAMQKLLAQNAAAGRRSAGLSLQNQLMMNQLSNIEKYRSGLNSAIRYPGYVSGVSGVSYAPQTTASSAGMLSTLSEAQKWNPDFQTGAGLSSIFY